MDWNKIKSLPNDCRIYTPDPYFFLIFKFLDEITLYYHGNDGKSDRMKVNVTRTDIAWESDKSYKFSNDPNGECETPGECTVPELKKSKCFII